MQVIDEYEARINELFIMEAFLITQIERSITSDVRHTLQSVLLVVQQRRATLVKNAWRFTDEW